jgi:hypothetical protein
MEATPLPLLQFQISLQKCFIFKLLPIIPPTTMRLSFFFLFAIAAALNSAHAQTPLVFTSNATLPSSPAGSPASIPVQITGGTQPYTFNLIKGVGH